MFSIDSTEPVPQHITQPKKLDDEPIKCSFCPKTFNDKSKLKQHEDMHQNIKSHECEICGHRTTWKQNLYRHMKIHTGEKPHACQVCDKSFRQSTVGSRVEFHNPEVHFNFF